MRHDTYDNSSITMLHPHSVLVRATEPGLAKAAPGPCAGRCAGCMTHWPALERWQHPEYLLAVAGQRTVPIELGKHYLEEGWGQSLISLGDFLRRHIMQAGVCCCCAVA